MKNCAMIAVIASLISIPPQATAGPKCQPKKFTAIPSLNKLNYHEMRVRMLSSGWFPVQTKPRGVVPDSDPDISTGNGREFWEKGYLEVESCAGTGITPCAFRWADKYGNHARLYTQGEESPKSKTYAMGNGGEFLCPNQE
jgi:hypothetical protein